MKLNGGCSSRGALLGLCHLTGFQTAHQSTWAHEEQNRISCQLNIPRLHTTMEGSLFRNLTWINQRNSCSGGWKSVLGVCLCINSKGPESQNMKEEVPGGLVKSSGICSTSIYFFNLFWSNFPHNMLIWEHAWTNKTIKSPWDHFKILFLKLLLYIESCLFKEQSLNKKHDKTKALCWEDQVCDYAGCN